MTHRRLGGSIVLEVRKLKRGVVVNRMIKGLGALCLGIGLLLIPAESYSENKGTMQGTTASRVQEGSGMQKGKGEVLTNTQKKKALKYLMERIGTDWKRAETVSPDTASQVEQEAKEKLEGDNSGE